MKRILALVLLPVLLTCSLASCEGSRLLQADGFSITLPRSFDSFDWENYLLVACRTSDRVYVFVQRDPYEPFGEDLPTPMEYAASRLEQFEYPNNAREEDGAVVFTYRAVAGSEIFEYTAYVFAGADSFYLCQFACAYEDAEKYRSDFKAWRDTVTYQ